MKSMIIMFSLVFFFSCSTQNMPQKDIDFYEVKGKVNHLTIRHYYAEENNGEIVKGEPNLEGEPDQTITFDKNGYISQVYFYGESDSLDIKLVREYNDKHLCIGETRYDANGYVLSDWIWFYDDNNNNTERVQVMMDSTLYTSMKLYYDDKNQLIAQKSMPNPQSGYFDSTYWVLDDLGRQTEEQNHGYYGLYGTKKVMYEAKSDLPAKIWFYDDYDELNYIVDIQYNNSDLVKIANQYDPDSTLVMSVSFEYTFDDKGNWVTKVLSYDGEPAAYEERRIIYY